MRSVLLGIFLIILTGCASPEVQDYAQTSPRFSLYEYFAGETRGWGMVQDRSGMVTRQFVVDITGQIENDVLVLDERFVWSDGEKSTRIWKITNSSPSVYSGTADDVVGTATGSSAGNALNWKYTLAVKSGDSTWNLWLDDWMFLQPDQVLINRTSMSKFGIHLGDVTIVFRKNDV